MSLNRLVTRLAVVSALNNYLDAPWPTLAGPNIFDSKIEPVEDMKVDRAFPCCVVYTDYDKNHWHKGSSAAKERLMTVTLELLIVQVAEVVTTDGAGIQTVQAYNLESPSTDSEIETTLDIFETQIFRALSAGNEASDCFNYICSGYDNIISRRGASIEGGQRLAARQLTMEMKSARDNTRGVIPNEIGVFLDRLEQHDDYKDRVDDIRAQYILGSGDTAMQQALRNFGYSRDMAVRLGAPGAPVVNLPSNLTFSLVPPG